MCLCICVYVFIYLYIYICIFYTHIYMGWYGCCHRCVLLSIYKRCVFSICSCDFYLNVEKKEEHKLKLLSSGK